MTPRIIEIPTIIDKRGSLSIVEAERNIPFKIKRVFFLYDVPVGQTRGGHAHKTLHQFLIALNGSVEVEAFSPSGDTITRSVHVLSSSSVGLYIPPMAWSTERNFADRTVCVALASDYFEESDYFRDYGEFLAATTALSHG
jgi:dTDP-4-dehydrorhamnose 3,5-epimerase-like enzyme